MDFTKSIFGDQALTYDQLVEKLKDNKDIKITAWLPVSMWDKAKLTAKSMN